MLTLLAVLVWRSDVCGFAREALYPFENLNVWFRRAVVSRVRGVFRRSAQAAECETLRRNLQRLELEIEELGKVEAENKRLSELLDLQPTARVRWQAARVHSRGGTTGVRQSIRVGKGSLHGVRVGDPAVVPEGVVGRVMTVSAKTADILLLTDPNCRIPVELELEGEDFGTVRGILHGGGTRTADDPTLTMIYVVEPLRIRYLERDFAPPPRTRVVTSGLGGAFPKGLTIGWMLDSREDVNGLSREAEVVPAVDFAGLETVFLLERGEAAP
ncbi:MAG: rod shape-determining protein MreC [Kiritimatiellae bacterium]|nr:rod shape-determining protein MreC [Kiritimatiellia bacterium]